MGTSEGLLAGPVLSPCKWGMGTLPGTLTTEGWLGLLEGLQTPNVGKRRHPNRKIVVRPAVYIRSKPRTRLACFLGARLCTRYNFNRTGRNRMGKVQPTPPRGELATHLTGGEGRVLWLLSNKQTVA
jgi:hypothetical protein